MSEDRDTSADARERAADARERRQDERERQQDSRESAVELRECAARAASRRVEEGRRTLGLPASTWNDHVREVIAEGLVQIQRNRLALDRVAAHLCRTSLAVDRREAAAVRAGLEPAAADAAAAARDSLAVARDGAADRRQALADDRERQLAEREVAVRLRELQVRAAEAYVAEQLRRLRRSRPPGIDARRRFEDLLDEIQRGRLELGRPETFHDPRPEHDPSGRDGSLSGRPGSGAG
jgi:hypothetical protein